MYYRIVIRIIYIYIYIYIYIFIYIYIYTRISKGRFIRIISWLSAYRGGTSSVHFLLKRWRSFRAPTSCCVWPIGDELAVSWPRLTRTRRRSPSSPPHRSRPARGTATSSSLPRWRLPAGDVCPRGACLGMRPPIRTHIRRSTARARGFGGRSSSPVTMGVTIECYNRRQYIHIYIYIYIYIYTLLPVWQSWLRRQTHKHANQVTKSWFKT